MKKKAVRIRFSEKKRLGVSVLSVKKSSALDSVLSVQKSSFMGSVRFGRIANIIKMICLHQFRVFEKQFYEIQATAESIYDKNNNFKLSRPQVGMHRRCRINPKLINSIFGTLHHITYFENLIKTKRHIFSKRNSGPDRDLLFC